MESEKKSRAEYMKAYRDANYEKIRAYKVTYNQEYFQLHQDKIMANRQTSESIKQYSNDYKQRIQTCVCWKTYKMSYFYTHRKKCKEYLESIQKDIVCIECPSKVDLGNIL